jgi:hypothetical protein
VIHLAILFKVDAGFLPLLFVVLDLLAGELSVKEYGAFMSVAPLAQNFAFFLRTTVLKHARDGRGAAKA